MTENHRTPLKIGLDYDSVITDSRAIKSAVAKERFGLDIPYQIFKWHTTVNGGLLTQEQYRDVQRTVHYGDEHNRVTPEVPGSIDGIKRLIAEGHELQVVTGRDGDSAAYARRWLREHGIEIPLTGVGDRKSKQPATTGLDIFIDDDLDKLEDLYVPHRFLYTWEFNLHVQLPKGISRISSWEDLYRKVNKIQENTTGGKT